MVSWKPLEHHSLTEPIQNSRVKSNKVCRIQYFEFRVFLEVDTIASRVKHCTSVSSLNLQTYA